MKHLLFTLFAALVFGGATFAQRLQIGFRAGANLTDYSFTPVEVGTIRVSRGAVRAGFETGLVLRLNIARHLHLQSELNYRMVNYEVNVQGAGRRTISLRTERLEIPLELGLQFGVFRLFGGAVFRVANAARSSAPRLLKVDFNNSDIGLMGGVGLNIRKFFIDFRMSGYPRSHVWQTFRSDGVSQRAKVSHDIVYGGSLGFFF
ncbi:MAG: porin family protein [Alistipes sp.]